MNKNKKIKRHLAMRLLMLAFATSVLAACDGTLERLTTESYPESGTNSTTGKVLCIVIDGASGKAVNTAYTTQRIPNIRKMRTNAVFTFDGLADTRNKDLPQFPNQRGWANLMTGETAHGVGLEKEPGGEIKTIDELDTPSFVERIKQIDAKRKVSIYAADNEFRQVFGPDADTSPALNTDSEVKEAILSEIGQTTTSDLIFAMFSGVQQTGLEKGFYDASGEPTQDVVEAIYDIDSYVGQVMDALQARENYKLENWMVIITTTYGGVYNGVNDPQTFYDDPRLNTFTMVYNYQMVDQILTRPGSDQLRYNYVTPLYNSNDEKSFASVMDPKLFDMPLGQSFTIQFMYYYPRNSGSHNWGNNVLSKSSARGANDGWQVWTNWGEFGMKVGNSEIRTWGLVGDTRYDGIWHTATIVVDRVANKYYAYADGKRGENNLSATYDLSTPDYPLTIGFITGGREWDYSLYCVSNVQVYDIALPDEYVVANHGLTRLDDQQNEYWDNLIGYWPCDREEDEGLTILKDYSQYAEQHNGKSDMKLSEKDWLTGGSVEANIISDPDDSYYTAVISNVDIPYQLMQWLGLSVSGYGFEGVAKTFKYTYMQEN